MLGPLSLDTCYLTLDILASPTVIAVGGPTASRKTALAAGGAGTGDRTRSGRCPAVLP